jgi:CubicO group peptidase (beta-lactamase class C family)
MAFDKALSLLSSACGKAFSGACVVVGKDGKVLWEETLGQTGYEEYGAVVTEVTNETLFDLASLTKPLCTATLCMIACEEVKIRLEDNMKLFLEEARGKRLGDVTIGTLLKHTSGLSAWKPFGSELLTRFGEGVAGTPFARGYVLEEILKEPIVNDAQVYSDLGYILLGFILERLYDTPIAELFRVAVARRFGIEDIFFVDRSVSACAIPKSRFAATEVCPVRKRVLQGEVHDENAFILGGSSGHAGLFGTARSVYLLSCALVKNLWRTMEKFLKRDEHETYCYGFDTPSKENSSSGEKRPEGLIGHLGFTGTSFWFEPKSMLGVVLLTNRVHPTRDNMLLKELRPRFHDAVWDEVLR